MISEFVEYVKQVWKDKPNTSSPLNATRLNHMESGIENNSKKIKGTITEVNELTEKLSNLEKRVADFPTIPTKVSQLTNDKNFTSNTGTITEIKMNGVSKGTSGVVDLGTVVTGGSQTITSTADGGSNVFEFSDGSTITVKNGSKGETGAKGDKGDKGDPGIQGVKGDTGAKGADGKTPVKGTDYWTEADKTAIVADVIAALPAAEGVSV